MQSSTSESTVGAEPVANNWLDATWGALTGALPLVVLAALLLILIALSALLPQMPGQLRGETLAAARWLTTTTESMGPLGPLLAGLGLLDVLHSLFFRVLLGATLFLLLIHAASAVLVALRYYQLPALLGDVSQSGGEALRVSMPYRVQRWRVAFPMAPIQASAAVEAEVKPWAPRVERRTVRITPSSVQLDGATSPAEAPPASMLEERLLGIRGSIETLLRPLLPAGMILAVAAIWWYSLSSHQFLPSPLLPGERASDAGLGVTFEYALTYPEANVIGPVLKVTKDATQQVFPLERNNVSIDGVVVDMQPGSPALIVRTLDDRPLLAQPGQANTLATLGLGFPNPGSEETLVLPEYGVGMRIIRQDNSTAPAADDSFAVEVFQGDSEQPVQRFTVGGSQAERIQTPLGEVPLGFVPLPMFQVRAYSAPGSWLLLPAALLVLAGVFGFRRKPAFLLAQAGIWPVDRSVVVVQTDRVGVLDALRLRLERERAPAQSDTEAEKKAPPAAV